MSYEVTVEPLGEVIEVEEDQTILDAALRAGVWKPRTRPGGFEGIGRAALPWLKEAGRMLNLPVMFD